MRGPTRLRITWLDDDTLKVETDYGMQTRLFQFRSAPAGAGTKTWQGVARRSGSSRAAAAAAARRASDR